MHDKIIPLLPSPLPPTPSSPPPSSPHTINREIAILGDRWPQKAKQDGDRISKQFIYSIWRKRDERPNVGSVSTRSRDGAPSRKGCVVNGQTTKASNK